MIERSYPLRYVRNTLEFDYGCDCVAFPTGTLSEMVAIRGATPLTGTVICAHRGVVPEGILRRAVIALNLNWDEFSERVMRRTQLLD